MRIFDSVRRVMYSPHYRHNPRQVVRRLGRAFMPRRSGLQTVMLPWGVQLEVDVGEFIGASIWATGVHDLAVSEAIWRVLNPGETAVDAGANVGYTMGLMALRVGREGSVLAYEPHPGLFNLLKHNTELLTRDPGACVPQLFPLALSDHDGRAAHDTDKECDTHHGLRYLAESPDGASEGIPVETRRLDETVTAGEISLLKLDVEGHEAQILRGASRLLAEKQIRTVINDARVGVNGPSHKVLADAGYALFALDSRLSGPFLTKLGTPRVTPSPDFLATTEPQEILRRFEAPGWEIFRRR
jgi:FkbM family methyltransferase